MGVTPSFVSDQLCSWQACHSKPQFPHLYDGGGNPAPPSMGETGPWVRLNLLWFPVIFSAQLHRTSPIERAHLENSCQGSSVPEGAKNPCGTEQKGPVITESFICKVNTRRDCFTTAW